jgi:hypothetical protein
MFYIKETPMGQRSNIWKETVGSVLKALSDAPDPAAREIGKVWRWAFERLEQYPNDFNQLQMTNSGKSDELVREFFRTTEARLNGHNVSDAPLVEKVVQYSLPLEEAPRSKQTSKEVADALAALGIKMAIAVQTLPTAFWTHLLLAHGSISTTQRIHGKPFMKRGLQQITPTHSTPVPSS